MLLSKYNELFSGSPMILARALPVEMAHAILKANVLIKAEIMPGAVLRSVIFLTPNNCFLFCD